ncbi:MAG: hypothetical protein LLG00_10245 [Planctomycetaceae bacterium]|nr:hypothetical protein [Planctomycetaceae bacterium]
MGQRANLVIVENGDYRLYYSHWCANTLPRDLFWGPDYAIAFIQAQRELNKSDWLDDVWAEGAAVVDRDKNVLLFYGGEDVLFDVPLRRVYLQMLARVWRAWEVRWAYEGIADIADYVGYPRERVLSEREVKPVCSLSPPSKREWTDLVASFTTAEGDIRLYPLAGSVESYLDSGPALVGECERHEAFDALPLNEWLDETFSGFPTGGVHIDVGSKTVDFWIADIATDVQHRISHRWPEWTVRWHRDAFERQLALTREAIRLPNRPERVLTKDVTEMLLMDDSGSRVDSVLDAAFTNLDGATGAVVEINPWSLRDDRLEIPLETRRRIVAWSLGESYLP